MDISGKTLKFELICDSAVQSLGTQLKEPKLIYSRSACISVDCSHLQSHKFNQDVLQQINKENVAYVYEVLCNH